ncbi:pentapeptide repeat-containing protein [Salmonella enterica]|uniref:Pentapeptide repeat-containing protein n=1 Tax=Salmonella enterica TaxID=28901 RepID=A0A5Z4QI21_SALER|nr:pentapeptide repeat-containing protein [Salmonella enterica]EAB5620621.1 pentapeptide repeat-containing protein [Salmonella enterica subsp. enterica serovar Mississippi]EDN5172472.1 pentapeptide repeat-containing protein [Salmonella enterica subsp. enterica]EDO6546562.1 pentapeptide repeat-containing protein [Salmonella enterica subsp. enterica serovar 4,[5],12:i:-]EEE7871913.1 pentapeptide repeat-containing protein [Salmonella enterica subsp. enterica serovar Enteritidis]
MNSADLSKILEEHKVWITSIRESGSRANLCGANLCGANLCGANLCGANLRGASLCGADLFGADLFGANLRGASLCGADLFGADLFGADLCGADLPDLTFVILGEKYFISITNGEYVRAGCQNHTVEEWRKYSKQEIAEMDGRKALKFYPRLLSIIDFYLGAGEWPDWVKNDGEE